jgi:hypothetical protein
MKKYSLMIAIALGTPSLSWAMGWSSCQTITAVSNYIAYSNTITVVLSPGIPGCASDAGGAVNFRVNQANVTLESLKSLLATTLTAYVSGKRVMVLYDETTPSCWGYSISVGGFAGQCP